MRKFTWIVLTNCEPGKDEEFNRWYDEVHIPDLLDTPGIVGARRSTLADAQVMMDENGLRLCTSKDIDARHRYLSIYDIEADDPEAVLRDVLARSGTERMHLSPTLVEAFTILFENRP